MWLLCSPSAWIFCSQKFSHSILTLTHPNVTTCYAYVKTHKYIIIFCKYLLSFISPDSQRDILSELADPTRAKKGENFHHSFADFNHLTSSSFLRIDHLASSSFPQIGDLANSVSHMCTRVQNLSGAKKNRPRGKKLGFHQKFFEK